MVLKVAMAMRNGQQIEGRDEWLGQNERTLRGGPRRRLVSKRGPASATSRARPWNAPPALRGGPKRPLVLSIPCGAGPRGPMCLACQLEPRLSLRDEAFAIFFFFFPPSATDQSVQTFSSANRPMPIADFHTHTHPGRRDGRCTACQNPLSLGALSQRPKHADGRRCNRTQPWPPCPGGSDIGGVRLAGGCCMSGTPE